MSGEIASFILSVIDLIWIPVAWFLVHERHRMIAAGFTLSCLFMLRMQHELLESYGFAETGITGWIEADPYYRGLITYSIVIILYLLMSHFSVRSFDSVYLAASISIFIFAMILSTIIMSV